MMLALEYSSLRLGVRLSLHPTPPRDGGEAEARRVSKRVSSRAVWHTVHFHNTHRNCRKHAAKKEAKR
jgi:hypothetical protein